MLLVLTIYFAFALPLVCNGTIEIQCIHGMVYYCTIKVTIQYNTINKYNMDAILVSYLACTIITYNDVLVQQIILTF